MCLGDTVCMCLCKCVYLIACNSSVKTRISNFNYILSVVVTVVVVDIVIVVAFVTALLHHL